MHIAVNVMCTSVDILSLILYSTCGAPLTMAALSQAWLISLLSCPLGRKNASPLQQRCADCVSGCILKRDELKITLSDVVMDADVP